MIRSVLVMILSIAGCLSFLVLGLRMMNDRLLLSFGSRIRRNLEQLEGRTLRAGLTGAVITGAFTSYEGLNVLLMSQLNAGLVGLETALTVATGAGAGQILPLWILAGAGLLPDLTGWILPLMALAVPLFLSRRRKVARTGNLMVSFLLVLVGIAMLKVVLPGTTEVPQMLYYVRSLGGNRGLSILVGFVLGAGIALLSRSSFAALVTAVLLVWSSWFSLAPALAVMFGSRLGMILTIHRASRPFPQKVRTFSAAVVFRLTTGALAGLAMVLPLESLAGRLLSGGSYRTTGVLVTAALVYTGYVLFISVVSVLLRRPLLFLAGRIRDRSAETGEPDDLPVLLRGIPDALEANLITTRSELGRMADTTHAMLLEALNASQNIPEAGEYREKMEQIHSELVRAEARVSRFLGVSIREPSGADQARDISAQTRVSRELLNIGEACTSVVSVFARIASKGHRIHDEAMDELFAYISQALDFMKYDSDYLARRLSNFDRDLALSLEKDLLKVRNTLRKRVRKTLEKDEDADIRGELQFNDVVRYVESIGDACLAIGVEIPKLR